jgi:hypothetical protein
MSPEGTRLRAYVEVWALEKKKFGFPKLRGMSEGTDIQSLEVTAMVEGFSSSIGR